MKKLLLFICAAMMIFSCGKEESGNKTEIDPVEPLGKATWATVFKAYPFLEGFPVFDGEVENWQYKEIGSMKTLIFFDYNCDKSVSTTYYNKFIPAGFTKSEGSHIYRKTVDKKNYIFSGSYGGGSFGLSFSVDTE